MIARISRRCPECGAELTLEQKDIDAIKRDMYGVEIICPVCLIGKVSLYRPRKPWSKPQDSAKSK